MAKPTCPLCTRRRARRFCPSLDRHICAVCCGTKRGVEITCTADCGYLRTSHDHPPAVVQRQQERDLRFLVPLLGGLTERQQQIAFLLQTFLRSERPEPPPLSDADVEQAAKAMAETFETASRGIVYEHHASSLPAQRLAANLKERIDTHRRDGARLPDTDVAIALRRIETAAREAKTELGGGPNAYLTLLERVLQPRDTAEAADSGQGAETADAGSRLIVPG